MKTPTTKMKAPAKAAIVQRSAGPGRPSTYTDELANRVLARLADGESLRAICATNGMPGRQTVLGWLDRDDNFRAKYARAREHQADALDDEMAEVMTELRAGRLDPAVARVLLGGLQWRASKLAPRRYGDAMSLKHSGAVGSAPLEMTAEHAARTARAILDGISTDGGAG